MRRYKKSRKSFKRKRYTRKRGGKSLAKRAMRGVKRINKMMRKEMNKIFYGEDNQPIDAGELTFLRRIGVPERGTDEQERIGNDIHSSSFRLTTKFFLSSDPMSASWFRRARVLVVESIASYGGGTQTPTFSQLFDTTRETSLGISTHWGLTDNDMCRYNPRFIPKAFRILKDVIIKIDQDDPFKRYVFKVPFKRSIKYDDFTGGTDYQYSNQLFVMVMPLDATYSPSAGQLLMAWAGEFRFYE